MDGNKVLFSITLAINRFIGKVLTFLIVSQPAITCSKLRIETLEQGVKYVQS